MMVRCRCRLCGRNAKVASADLAGKEDGNWICVRCAKGRMSWLRELSMARPGGPKPRATPQQVEEEEEAPPPSGMMRLSDLRELARQSQSSLPPPAWGEPEPAPPSVRAAIRGCDLFPAAPVPTLTPVPPPSMIPPPMARSVPGEMIAAAPPRLRHTLNLVIVAVMAASLMVIVLHALDRRAPVVEGKVALVSAALAGDAVRDAIRPPPTDGASNAIVPDATASMNKPVNAPAAVGAVTPAPASAPLGGAQSLAASGTGARGEKAPPAEPGAPAAEPASKEAQAAGAAPASLADAMAAAVGKTAPAAVPAAEPANTAEAPASEPAFDTAAARSSMRSIAGSLGACKSSPDEEGGSGSVRVTFAPSGAVTQASVEGGGFSGTPLGSCIANRFRGARVPPFAGSPVTVRQPFTVR
ncbi:hypothetical protein [Polyangium aurulentum]|uniref:hypothetical protein n=1 Tax=Polyangium aurulentum TaxID=2567896 RepID=UPI0010AEC068|nr:hypothetical protein [Polyangium aurulentum]UQA61773.1 hypothetical protein E8A73_015395 [Polyangium aurulentum]